MSAHPFKPTAVKVKYLVFFFSVFFFSTRSSFASPAYTQPKSSSFTARFMNLEQTSRETFRFNANLFNGQGHPVSYNLRANVPDGWSVSFKVQGMQLTSFQLDSNKAQDVSIEVVPSPLAKPGKYDIGVEAVSDMNSQLQLNLQAVVKGSYSLLLSTPNGLLSGEATEGHSKSIVVTLKNTGSLPMDNINLTSQTPASWSMTFEPSKIDRLDPGGSVNVTAQLNVPDKTLAGDYQATVTASNTNVSSNFTYRLTVTTSWLTGGIGVLVILAAVGMIYYLIKKYGRR